MITELMVRGCRTIRCLDSLDSLSLSSTAVHSLVESINPADVSSELLFAGGAANLEIPDSTSAS